jgi:hypothetical protein
MTARSRSAELARADEMRARILRNVEAWIALRRPRRFEYDPAEFTIVNDHRGRMAHERDPRAVELEYTELRLAFWNADTAGDVRIIARRAVTLARNLASRQLVTAE